MASHHDSLSWGLIFQIRVSPGFCSVMADIVIAQCRACTEPKSHSTYFLGEMRVMSMLSLQMAQSDVSTWNLDYMRQLVRMKHEEHS